MAILTTRFGGRRDLLSMGSQVVASPAASARRKAASGQAETREEYEIGARDAGWQTQNRSSHGHTKANEYPDAQRLAHGTVYLPRTTRRFPGLSRMLSSLARQLSYDLLPDYEKVFCLGSQVKPAGLPSFNLRRSPIPGAAVSGGVT